MYKTFEKNYLNNMVKISISFANKKASIELFEVQVNICTSNNTSSLSKYIFRQRTGMEIEKLTKKKYSQS
jgi:hypothetical protein